MKIDIQKSGALIAINWLADKANYKILHGDNCKNKIK